MKRYITIALCALTVFGLGSCNKVHEEDFDNAGRSVTFQAQLGNDTRTGLALKFVPDWRQTTLSDVHIWEVAGSERYEGEDVKMRIPGEAEGNYEIALFKADFSNMTIIVNPPSNAPTRAGETYTYTSIVAPKDASGKFTVPSTQTPNSATLIDPHADFIVGKSPAPFDQSQAGKEVNLIFTRPVAISRLSIMNVEDPTIKQVKIYSSDKLTGSASYENVDFANATVSFDNSGSNVITLDYGSGVAMPAEGIFNAYFISLVGTKRITKIEVVTNAQTLTKEFEGGKALTFKVPDFKSIAVNMGGSGTPGPNPDQPQNIQFVRGTTVVTSDSYDLYTGGTYVSPTISGAAPGATLTYETGDPSVATVSTAGVVTPVGVGTTTITANASKVEGYQAGSAEFTLTVTDSTPEPVNQPLTFTRNGEEVPSQETYDLHSGAAYVSPILSGAVENATVTYDFSCTPEGCATIDADGKITPVAVGVAIVTATASAVAPLYNETSKTYTLQIVDTTPATTTAYYKVDQIVAGQQYIVVSGGKALTVTGTTLGAVAVVDNNGVIETSEDVAVWTAAEHIEYYSGTSAAGHFTLKSGDNYLQRKSNQANQTAAVGDVPSTGKYYVWEYDGTHLYHLSSATTTFYMGYADNVWKFNYQTPYYEASLYSTTEPEAPVVVEQELSFDPTSVVGSVGGVVTSPTLTGAKTPVSYSSSDPSVVTVNAETGALTLRDVGEADITATAAAGTVGGINYGEGSASYHVTVVPPLEPVAETTYTLVTGNLSADTYILVSDDSSSSYNNRYTVALFPTVVTTSWSGTSPVENGQRFNEKDVTLNGNSITTDDPEIVGAEIELVASGSGWKIKAKATGEYLVVPTASYRIPVSTDANDAAVFTITTSQQNRSITTTGSYYFFHSGSATGFTIRNTNSAVSNVRFYKKAKKTQALSFSGSSATYDLKDGSWTNAVPALDKTEAKTTVTYASSNTAVAEVNSTTGAITIPSTAKKGDSATITATAEATDEYEEATASYTISIVDTTPGVSKVFKKVTAQSELAVDATYLIVYENSDGSKVFKPIVSGNTFTTTTANALDVTISSNTITSSDLDDCMIVLKNGEGSKFAMWVPAVERYMILRRSNTSLVADATDNGYRTTFTVNDGSVTMVRDNYYFRYSSSNQYFQVNTTNSSVALYKLDDGTTPDTPEPPTPTTYTYSLITPSEFVSGGTYLIVSADSGNYNKLDKKAAFAGDTNGSIVDVDGTSGTITGDFSACEFVITESGGNYTLKIGSNYVTGNPNSGSRYIQVSTTAGTMSLATAAEAPDPGKTGEGLVADAFYFYYTKTSGGTTSKEVLYLNSDGKYKIGGSGRKYGAYLFKKN